MIIRGRFILVALSMCMLAACSKSGDSIPAKEIPLDVAAVGEDLRTLAGARILLGHQSVGRDVLAGLQSLATETGTPLRIVQIDGVPPDDQPGLFHSNIGRNGDPNSKCEVFSQLLTRPERPVYEAAMMKFCYEDLDPGVALTSQQVLDRYARVVGDVRAARPDIKLVHITVPLFAEPVGKKARLFRMVGMALDGDESNEQRNLFNDGLRERFAGEPLFDLATIESTLPDGTRSSFSRNGRTIYSLARAYTNDGGHLNANAQRRAAAAFARSVAEALRDS